MNIKKVMLILVSLSFLINIAWAGELLKEQANEYYQEGLKAQKRGELGAAETAYHKLLLLQSADMNLRKVVFNNLAVISIRSGDLVTAEATLMDILSIDPNYRPAQFNLGLIYDKGSDKIKAMEYWNEVFKNIKPKDFIIAEVEVPKK